MSKTITREALYELVWSTPMRKLCQEYNISDRGLAKICERKKIPLPPRGYWRKLETNKSVERIPLPSEISGNLEITINDEKPSSVKNGVPGISVPEEMSKPHPLIEQSRKLLRAAKVNEKHIIPATTNTLDIRVSKSSLSRSLLIIDTLLKTFEQQDIAVTLELKGEIHRTAANVCGQKLYFFLEEILQSFVRRTDKWGNKEYGWEPTGKLVLRIDNYDQFLGRRNWSDGKRQRVEDCLGHFISVVNDWGPKKSVHEEELEQQHQQYEARRKLMREDAERKRTVETEIASWEHSQKIRNYAKALEATASKNENVNIWIDWIRRYADSLDPTVSYASGEIPKIDSRFVPDFRMFPSW